MKIEVYIYGTDKKLGIFLNVGLNPHHENMVWFLCKDGTIKSEYFENIELKTITPEKNESSIRIEKLANFLSLVSDENDDAKVLAADIMGYIRGYCDITSDPEDEIEIFN